MAVARMTVSGRGLTNQSWPVAPNLLEQDFTATGPDRKWGADIP
jgi:hypothetical protein